VPQLGIRVRMLEAKSLGDLLRTSCTTWADRTAMRRLKRDGEEALTYAQLWEEVRRYARALQDLGLQKGDRMCIQCENCTEWALVDWAAQCLGVVVVPIYPTLPPEQTQYIANDSGAQVIIAGQDQAHKTEGITVVEMQTLAERARQGEALSAAEIERLIDRSTRDDLATIIYTSGTTGNPKGAMLTHGNFTFLMPQIILNLPIDENDTFLSFLPLSHVYERVAGHVLPLATGACIAYAQNLRTLADDMQRAKPTIMLCVPRFLESVRDKVLDAMAKASPLRRKLFEWALTQGARKANGKFAPFAVILDMIVGAKIRARTGGRIRFFVSGGAALPPHVAEFFRAFRLNVLQGYGLTETTAASAVNHPDPTRNKPETVGEPIPGVEFRIADDGEILIRGRTVMKGYYNMPEETALAIDKDGWFHTGDIGAFDGNHIKITDRKKDLLVLANGKNVAPQPIENLLRESPLISEAVLFGDGMEYVCALIIPNRDTLSHQLPGGFEKTDLARDEVRAAIKAELDKVNKRLPDFEKVKKFELLDTTFSVDSGELTPSMKVKRKVVKERYADLIKRMAR
jgi:long-chain acyl-CoA synthetase